VSYIPAQVKCEECPKSSAMNGQFFVICKQNNTIKLTVLSDEPGEVHQLITPKTAGKIKHACSPECAGKIIISLLKELRQRGTNDSK